MERAGQPPQADVQHHTMAQLVQQGEQEAAWPDEFLRLPVSALRQASGQASPGWSRAR